MILNPCKKLKKISEDVDLLFLHYYIKRGFTLEYLNNISIYDKNFMIASMMLDSEEKGEIWDALSG